MDRFKIHDLVVDVVLYFLNQNMSLDEVFSKEKITEVFNKNYIRYNDKYVSDVLETIKDKLHTSLYDRIEMKRKLHNMKFNY